jgi:hypothetical protein
MNSVIKRVAIQALTLQSPNKALCDISHYKKYVFHVRTFWIEWLNNYSPNVTNLSIIFLFGECTIWLTIKKNACLLWESSFMIPIKFNAIYYAWSIQHFHVDIVTSVVMTWHSKCDLDYNLYTSAKICD